MNSISEIIIIKTIIIIELTTIEIFQEFDSFQIFEL
jgi:hypothetical protein